MAAGPGTVKCYNNIFLCSTCEEELAFVNSIIKDYPKFSSKIYLKGKGYIGLCLPKDHTFMIFYELVCIWAFGQTTTNYLLFSVLLS